jgi:hypothetical protein
MEDTCRPASGGGCRREMSRDARLVRPPRAMFLSSPGVRAGRQKANRQPSGQVGSRFYGVHDETSRHVAAAWLSRRVSALKLMAEGKKFDGEGQRLGGRGRG